MNVFSYLKHVREEFQHIVWPSSHKAIAHTLVVILIAVVIALGIALLDYGLQSVVSNIVGA